MSKGIDLGNWVEERNVAYLAVSPSEDIVGNSEVYFRSLRDAVATRVFPISTQAVGIGLGEVEHTPSSFLSACLGIRKELDERGRGFFLLNPQQQTRVVLGITKLDDVFDVYDSVQDAVAAYS